MRLPAHSLVRDVCCFVYVSGLGQLVCYVGVGVSFPQCFMFLCACYLRRPLPIGLHRPRCWPSALCLGVVPAPFAAGIMIVNRQFSASSFSSCLQLPHAVQAWTLLRPPPLRSRERPPSRRASTGASRCPSPSASTLTASRKVAGRMNLGSKAFNIVGLDNMRYSVIGFAIGQAAINKILRPWHPGLCIQLTNISLGASSLGAARMSRQRTS